MYYSTYVRCIIMIHIKYSDILSHFFRYDYPYLSWKEKKRKKEGEEDERKKEIMNEFRIRGIERDGIGNLPKKIVMLYSLEGDWKDGGSYYYLEGKQLSDSWFKHHKFRLSGSKAGAAIGVCSFNTPMDIIFRIIDVEKKVPCITMFDEKGEIIRVERKDVIFLQAGMKPVDVMNRGVKGEWKGRSYYEKKFNVKVIEVCMAVPKWNIQLCLSPDGLVGEDGSIEIKLLLKIPQKIKEYLDRIGKGQIFDKYYHDHISDSHYIQMYMCMAVWKRAWCDYIIYCEPDNFVFIYRVWFREGEWNRIYRRILWFLNRLLNPMLMLL